MQSENGMLLLFYIFLSHGNEKKTLNIFFKGVGCKKGDAVSCPQAPVINSTDPQNKTHDISHSNEKKKPFL